MNVRLYRRSETLRNASFGICRLEFRNSQRHLQSWIDTVYARPCIGLTISPQFDVDLATSVYKYSWNDLPQSREFGLDYISHVDRCVREEQNGRLLRIISLQIELVESSRLYEIYSLQQKIIDLAMLWE